MVLSIGTDGDAGYYISQQAEYYTGGAEPNGRWYTPDGQFGLADGTEIDNAIFRELMAGVAPDGTVIGRAPKNPNLTRVSSYDLTFSVPKSVSILWALAEPETRARIEDALYRSVHRTLATAQDNAAFLRQGHNGTELVPTRLFGALFQHGDARPMDDGKGNVLADMNLHIHSVIFNLAQDPHQEWYALDARHILAWKMALGATHHAELARLLEAELGCRIKLTGHNGEFEVEGVPSDVIAHFSRRRAQIEESLKAYGLSSADAPELAAAITRLSREAKPDVSTAEKADARFDRWAAEALAQGFSAREVLACFLRPLSAGERRARDAEFQAALKTLVFDITETTAVVERRDVHRHVAAVCAAYGRGADEAERITADLIDPTVLPSNLLAWADADFDEFMAAKAAAGRLVALPQLQDLAERPRLTAPDLIQAERGIWRLVDRHVDDVRHMIPYADVEAHIQSLRASTDPASPPPTEEQENGIRYVTTHRGLVSVLEGAAGSGKSVTLKQITALYRDVLGPKLGVDYRVLGCSAKWLTAKAMIADADLADEDARAAAKWIADIRAGKEVIGERTVLLVDEAGQMGSRDLHALLQPFMAAGAKIILTGDRAQQRGVGAGPALDIVASRIGSLRLERTQRMSPQADDVLMHRDGLSREEAITRAYGLSRERRRILVDGAAPAVRAEVRARFSDPTYVVTAEDVLIWARGLAPLEAARDLAARSADGVRRLRAESEDARAAAMAWAADSEAPVSPAQVYHYLDGVPWRVAEKRAELLTAEEGEFLLRGHAAAVRAAVLAWAQSPDSAVTAADAMVWLDGVERRTAEALTRDMETIDDHFEADFDDGYGGIGPGDGQGGEEAQEFDAFGPRPRPASETGHGLPAMPRLPVDGDAEGTAVLLPGDAHPDLDVERSPASGAVRRPGLQEERLTVPPADFEPFSAASSLAANPSSTITPERAAAAKAAALAWAKAASPRPKAEDVLHWVHGLSWERAFERVDGMAPGDRDALVAAQGAAAIDAAMAWANNPTETITAADVLVHVYGLTRTEAETRAGALADDQRAKLVARHYHTVRDAGQIWTRQAATDFSYGPADPALTARALKAFQDHGRLKWLQTHDDALRAAVEDWKAYTAANPDALAIVLAKSNADVRTLNRLMRAHLREKGHIAPTELVVETVARQRLGQGHLPVDLPIAVGEQILFTRRDDALGVVNGTVAKVLALARSAHPGHAVLTVRIDTQDGARDITFDTAAYTDEQDRSAKKPGRAMIEHSYALTTFSAQGMTRTATFAQVDSSQSSNSAYVAASRARALTMLYASRANEDAYLSAALPLTQRRAAVFTDRDRFRALARHLAREQTKSSVLDAFDEGWRERIRTERAEGYYDPIDLHWRTLTDTDIEEMFVASSDYDPSAAIVHDDGTLAAVPDYLNAPDSFADAVPDGPDGYDDAYVPPALDHLPPPPLQPPAARRRSTAPKAAPASPAPSDPAPFLPASSTTLSEAVPHRTWRPVWRPPMPGNHAAEKPPLPKAAQFATLDGAPFPRPRGAATSGLGGHMPPLDDSPVAPRRRNFVPYPNRRQRHDGPRYDSEQIRREMEEVLHGGVDFRDLLDQAGWRPVSTNNPNINCFWTLGSTRKLDPANTISIVRKGDTWVWTSKDGGRGGNLISWGVEYQGWKTGGRDYIDLWKDLRQLLPGAPPLPDEPPETPEQARAREQARAGAAERRAQERLRHEAELRAEIAATHARAPEMWARLLTPASTGAGNYLEGRGITRATQYRYADAIRFDPKTGFVAFKHTAADGSMTGFERKRDGWNMFTTGVGGKAVALFGDPSARLARIVIVETGVDAVSVAQLDGVPDDALYVSTGGQSNSSMDGDDTTRFAAEHIRALAARHPDAVIEIATDRDRGGNAQAAGWATLLAGHPGGLYRRVSARTNDWNNELRLDAGLLAADHYRKDLRKADPPLPPPITRPDLIPHWQAYEGARPTLPAVLEIIAKAVGAWDEKAAAVDRRAWDAPSATVGRDLWNQIHEGISADYPLPAAIEAAIPARLAGWHAWTVQAPAFEALHDRLARTLAWGPNDRLDHTRWRASGAADFLAEIGERIRRDGLPLADAIPVAVQALSATGRPASDVVETLEAFGAELRADPDNLHLPPPDPAAYPVFPALAALAADLTAQHRPLPDPVAYSPASASRFMVQPTPVSAGGSNPPPFAPAPPAETPGPAAVPAPSSPPASSEGLDMAAIEAAPASLFDEPPPPDEDSYGAEPPPPTEADIASMMRDRFMSPSDLDPDLQPPEDPIMANALSAAPGTPNFDDERARARRSEDAVAAAAVEAEAAARAARASADRRVRAEDARNRMAGLSSDRTVRPGPPRPDESMTIGEEFGVDSSPEKQRADFLKQLGAWYKTHLSAKHEQELAWVRFRPGHWSDEVVIEFRDGSRMRDNGRDLLLTGQPSPQKAELMIEIAAAKGMTSLHLRGGRDFKRDLAKACFEHGIEVQNIELRSYMAALAQAMPERAGIYRRNAEAGLAAEAALTAGNDNHASPIPAADTEPPAPPSAEAAAPAIEDAPEDLPPEAAEVDAGPADTVVEVGPVPDMDAEPPLDLSGWVPEPDPVLTRNDNPPDFSGVAEILDRAAAHTPEDPEAVEWSDVSVDLPDAPAPAAESATLPDLLRTAASPEAAPLDAAHAAYTAASLAASLAATNPSAFMASILDALPEAASDPTPDLALSELADRLRTQEVTALLRAPQDALVADARFSDAYKADCAPLLLAAATVSASGLSTMEGAPLAAFKAAGEAHAAVAALSDAYPAGHRLAAPIAAYAATHLPIVADAMGQAAPSVLALRNGPDAPSRSELSAAALALLAPPEGTAEAAAFRDRDALLDAAAVLRADKTALPIHRAFAAGVAGRLLATAPTPPQMLADVQREELAYLTNVDPAYALRDSPSSAYANRVLPRVLANEAFAELTFTIDAHVPGYYEAERAEADRLFAAAVPGLSQEARDAITVAANKALGANLALQTTETLPDHLRAGTAYRVDFARAVADAVTSPAIEAAPAVAALPPLDSWRHPMAARIATLGAQLAAAPLPARRVLAAAQLFGAVSEAAPIVAGIEGGQGAAVDADAAEIRRAVRDAIPWSMLAAAASVTADDIRPDATTRVDNALQLLGWHANPATQGLAVADVMTGLPRGPEADAVLAWLSLAEREQSVAAHMEAPPANPSTLVLAFEDAERAIVAAEVAAGHAAAAGNAPLLAAARHAESAATALAHKLAVQIVEDPAAARHAAAYGIERSVTQHANSPQDQDALHQPAGDGGWSQ